ncbi:MAG: hypothetical protein EBV86_11600 [Marivivens sp.]|nr:hypothetical protein [Marivivens sp.]
MMNKSLSYAYPQRFAEGGAALPGLDTYDQNQVAYMRQLTDAMGGEFSDDDIAQLMRYGFGSREQVSMDLAKRVMPGDASGQTSILDAMGIVGQYDPNQTYTNPAIETTTGLPPTPPMPDLNLGMGNVASAFSDNPPSPTAGQDAYQQFTVTTNPQIASLYTPPEQQGVGSLMDNPLVQQSNDSLTNPYLQSSAPTQSVFQRPPGG